MQSHLQGCRMYVGTFQFIAEMFQLSCWLQRKRLLITTHHIVGKLNIDYKRTSSSKLLEKIVLALIWLVHNVYQHTPSHERQWERLIREREPIARKKRCHKNGKDNVSNPVSSTVDWKVNWKVNWLACSWGPETRTMYRGKD